MISVRPTARGGLLGACASLVLASGSAFAQSSNVIFKSNLDQYSGYANCWGYTAPNGDEYALLGTNTGLSVVNIVDPENPYETGSFAGSSSMWREIKTFGPYVYVVNETGGGVMIVDLSNPENPVQRPSYAGVTTAHTLYVDEATARLYLAGSNVGNGGIRILSLANPLSPTPLGNWENQYIHDITVKDNVLYAAAIYQGQLRIFNATNPASLTLLGTISGYPHAFTHNSWPTTDGDYVMTTDEESGASVRLWNISNLPVYNETDSYLANGVSIPHNAHLDGNVAFISHYTLGVRIVDITNRNDIHEVGWYDTYPANDGGSFNGCWGVFPYFGTNEHLFIASDISTGLWVFEYRGTLGTVAGEVTRTGSPGTKIAGALLEVVQTGATATTNASGQYSLQDAAGSVDLEVSAYGYYPKTVPVTIVQGVTVPLNVTLDLLPSGSLSGTVSDAVTTLPVAGASVEIVSTPLVAVSGPLGDYEHDAIPVGTYTVRITKFGYNPTEATLQIQAGVATVLNVPLHAAGYASDFETSPGWTVSGNATVGQWERADPQPTEVQPGDDHTPPPGVNAWITGPLAGSSVGTYDVDGGATILTTPVYDFSALANARVSYWRWYVTGFESNPSTDFWVAEISSNAGATWTWIEHTDTANPAWVKVDLPLAGLVSAPYNQIRFRFTAQDTGTASVTEAGLDDFQVYQLEVLGPGTDIPPILADKDDLFLTDTFPNPFRPGHATTMILALGAEERVTAQVFDVAGRRVATILDAVLPAGTHRVQWEGRGDDGQLRSAGVYFVKLQSARSERTRKLVLVQ